MRQVQERSRSARKPAAPRGEHGLLRRFLTHSATIMVAVVGTFAVVIYSFDFGKGHTSPPPAGNLSIQQLSALLNNTQVDPVTADAVAKAKERAHDQMVAAQKAAAAKAAHDAKVAAAQSAKAKASRSAAALRNAATNPAANKRLGEQMNALKGWSQCWPSLLTMWNHESGWDQTARNPYGGAYGIPQALPGSKMASAGSDWQTSSATQIAWGLGYIASRYGDPCKAWGFWQAHQWY